MAAASFLKTNYSFSSYLTLVFDSVGLIVVSLGLAWVLMILKSFVWFLGISNFLEIRLENRNHSRTKANGKC